MNVLRLLPEPLREKQLRRLVSPYTLVGQERLRHLYRLAQLIERERIPGDVVECGVFKGGTGAILAHFATHSQLNRRIWLFDSFQGMPETTERDTAGFDGVPAVDFVGQVVGDTQSVNEVLARVGANLGNVRIVPGWFHETFPSLPDFDIALLNIDADWYDSVRLCLDTFYDRVTVGGIVWLDDYGHWPGCREAVDDFFADRGISPELRKADFTARWFRKP